MRNVLEIVVEELVFLFAPLAIAVSADAQPAVRYFDYESDTVGTLPPDARRQVLTLLAAAGVDLRARADEIETQLDALVTAGDALNAVLERIRNGQPPSILDMQKAVSDVRSEVGKFGDGLPSVDGVPPAREVVTALMEHLLVRYLRVRRPTLWHAACLLGITDPAAVTAAKRGQFHIDRIWPAVSDPAASFGTATGWGNDLDHEFLLAHLGGLARAVGLDLRTIEPPEHPFAEPFEPPEEAPSALSLALPGFDLPAGAASADVDLVAVLSPLPAEGAAKEGLLAMLLATGKASLERDIGTDWKASFQSNFAATAPVAFSMRPGIAEVVTTGAGEGLSAEASIEISERVPLPREALTLGPISMTLPAPKLRTSATRGDPSRFNVEAVLAPIEIALDPGGADGFVSKLVPKPLGTSFDMTVGWEQGRGFYLQRGGGLQVDIPVGLTLGGVVTVLSVGAALSHVEGEPAGSQRLSLGTTGKAKLGPLSVTVEGLGVNLEGQLPASAAEVEALVASFKSPTGVGLSLEAGPVQGGGYISHNADAGRYVGALSLQVSGLGLQAFGILDTKLPDGGDGFSLLVTVAGRFAPIPLGFGFTLSGVGGLLGLHRDVDVPTLRESVRAGTAGDILAPKDPIGDAPRIAEQAGALFPVTRGQHVFGPTVKLGWGQPKELVSLDLALALTLPDPLRLVLIGRVRVAVPDPALPLVKLNMDTFGVLDMTASILEAEGSLFDSAIQGLPVTGGFAVLSRWGDAPALAFSVGGLHPAFEGPPGFPQVPRLGIDLSRNSVSLTLEGYFAITSNSVQLGARAALRAGAAGFTLSGELGFDALVIFEPFGVDLAIYANASVKRGSRSICSVSVNGRLTGPGPWHITGEARIEVLFFDTGVDFAVSIGKPESAPLRTERPEDLLVTALAAPRAWSAEADPGPFVLDHMEGLVPPGARLEVSQTTVPLDLLIEKIGPNPIVGARRFSIASLGVGGIRLSVTGKRHEHFAAAQFIEMSDAEKLAAPGYEPMPSGARFAGVDDIESGRRDDFATGRMCVVIDAPDGEPEAPRVVRFSPLMPRPPDRRRARVRVQPKGRITVAEETWQAIGPGMEPDGTGGTSSAEARVRARQHGGAAARSAEIAA